MQMTFLVSRPLLVDEVVDSKRHAVDVVADKTSFPGTMLELLVRFHMHERSHPDRPKVSMMSVLAIDRLVSRLISQCCVWNPVAHVDIRLHQLSPEKVW